MVLEILRVAGMRSERDRRAVSEAARAVPGVRSAVANLADHTLRVEREDDAPLAAIIQAISSAGYQVSVLV